MGTISVLTGKDENKLIVICYTIISFVMTLAYILEFVKVTGLWAIPLLLQC